MEDKDLKEKDFQVYIGWKTPFFIKFAWLGLVVWITFYLVTFFYPSLKEWLNR